MRFPFACLAFLCATALPLRAHADAIDDIIFTGPGVNMVFTLPASETVVHYPVLVQGPAFTSTGGTVNGVGGYRISASFFTFASAGESLLLNASSTVAGAPSYDFTLYGSSMVSVDFSDPPGFDLISLDPGGATLRTLDFNTGQLTPYFITITPDPGIAPEPSSLLLLATGSLALLAGARQRRVPHLRRGLHRA